MLKRMSVIAVAAAGFAIGPAASPGWADTSTVQGFWAVHRSNHFNTERSCDTYGYGATNAGNGPGNGYVPGATNWDCWKVSGDSKYSIKLWYP